MQPGGSHRAVGGEGLGAVEFDGHKLSGVAKGGCEDGPGGDGAVGIPLVGHVVAHNPSRHHVEICGQKNRAGGRTKGIDGADDDVAQRCAS